jgi:hypothetical protein
MHRCQITFVSKIIALNESVKHKLLTISIVALEIKSALYDHQQVGEDVCLDHKKRLAGDLCGQRKQANSSKIYNLVLTHCDL